MTCRVDSRRNAAPPEPLEPAVERPKRVDAYIDYFGDGEPRGAGVSSDPCGEWWLDGAGR